MNNNKRILVIALIDLGLFLICNLTAALFKHNERIRGLRFVLCRSPKPVAPRGISSLMVKKAGVLRRNSLVQFSDLSPPVFLRLMLLHLILYNSARSGSQTRELGQQFS